MNKLTPYMALFLGLSLLSTPSEALFGKKKTSEFIKVEGVSIPENKMKVPPVSKDQPIVVISVDGGGVRGIVPTVMIGAMEEALKKDITRIGDVFAGTSAGSIVIGLLNIPGHDGKPMFSGTKALEVSTHIIKEIFHNSAKRKIRTLGGLAGAKYSAKPLEKYLKDFTGKTTVGSTIKPVLITSVDITNDQPYIFSTAEAFDDPDTKNLPLWMAIRSSSAAPTFFKPLGIEVDGVQYRLVDGGIVANNPEILGLLDAMELYPDHKKFILVSLATGKPAIKRKLSIKGNNAGNLLQMLLPTINSSLDSQSALSTRMVNKIAKGKRIDVEYHRIDVEVPKACAALDNASDKNLACLKKVALEHVEKDNFKTMLASLKRAKSPHLAPQRANPMVTEAEDDEDDDDN